MNTSEHILVIMLSTALAVLLVLAIAVAVQAYKLIKAVQRVTDKAEHIIQSAEHASAAFANATGSLAVVRVVKNVLEMVAKSKSKSKSK
jgi:hypothetical protein